MSITDLPALVKQFWQAVAPRAAELAATVFVFAFALGLDAPATGVTFRYQELQPSAGVERLLETYGIDKVLPFAVLFLLVVLAQANARVFRLLGSRLPVHLRSDADRVFVAASSGGVTLLQLRANLRGRPFSAIRKIVDREIERTVRPNAVLQQLDGTLASLRSLTHFVKGLAFALVVTVVAFLAGRGMLDLPALDLWRVAALVAAFVAVLVYLAVRRMALESECAGTRARMYLNWLESTQASVPIDYDNEGDLEAVREARAGLKEGCWSFTWRSPVADGELGWQIVRAFLPWPRGAGAPAGAASLTPGGGTPAP